MSFWGHILDRLERRLLLRSMGLDPAECDKPARQDDPIRDQLIEVRTTSGWRVWRRDDLKTRD